MVNRNKKAWIIRYKAAQNQNCKVLEVQWGECLKLTKVSDISYINGIVKQYTKFDNIRDLFWYCKVNRVNPIFKTSKHQILINVVNYFNMIMVLANSKLIAKTN